MSRLSAGAASGRAATAEKTLDKLNAEGVKVPCLYHALSSSSYAAFRLTGSASCRVLSTM